MDKIQPSTSKNKIRIVVVDDSAVFRSSLVNFFSDSDKIEVAAEASDAAEARKKLSMLSPKPHVVLIDLSSQKPESISLIKELAEHRFIPCVVMYDPSTKISDSVLAAEFIKKPRHSSEMGTFCTLLHTKIIITAKTVEEGKGILPVTTSTAIKGKADPILPAREDIVGLDRRARDGYVVALGASTGGTDALECIIRSFPATMPPVLVVQHMPPVFTKLYSDRLDKCCAVNVKEAQDGDRLAQGLCLIAAGGFHMELKKDSKGYYVKCYSGEKVSGHCPSVDVMFSSVAETAGNKAIGALMTGMGADGATGLLKMHQKGAHTIGQDKESFVVYGMPMEAYKLGACSEQQSLENIGKTLCRRLTDGWNKG